MILTQEEIISLKLRELYSSYGYNFYRMKRFEEYDFYAGKRDFLPPGAILTFTDTNGKLMALRPDVTLSIIKHAPSGKYYYDEKVYRVPKHSDRFREIAQCGVECTGPSSDNNTREILRLAAESLSIAAGGRDYAIDVADAGLLARIVPDNIRAEALSLIAAKNIHGLREINAPHDVIALAENSLDIPQLTGIISGIEHCRVDFSCVSSLSYYTGLVFRGWIDGIPDAVISGGQYSVDGEKGIGFAVYLDAVAGGYHD